MAAGSSLIDAYKLLRHAGVEPGMHVADFGCGQSGHLVFPAARHVGDAGHVYAVDIRPSVLETLGNHIPHARTQNITTVWGDFEASGGVQIPESSLDRAFLVNGMWVVNDMDATLAEMRRLLKDDGKIVLVDWNKRVDHPVAPPVHARTERVAAMRALAGNGLRRMTDGPMGQTHWIVVADLA